jgi:hypothetical protein
MANGMNKGGAEEDGHETRDAPDGDPFEVKGLSTARYAAQIDGNGGAAVVGRKAKNPYGDPKANEPTD